MIISTKNNDIKWTEDEVNILLEFYPIMPKYDLLNKLQNRTWQTIQQKSATLGIKRINREVIRDTSNMGSKNKCALNMLVNNDEEQTYYWIGFLMADGWFCHDYLGLQLAAKDKNQLESFLSYIKYNKILKLKSKGIYKSYSLTINDKNNINQIKNKYDIKPNKTYNPPNLDSVFLSVEKSKIFSYIVGFIDGDGSIRKMTKNKYEGYQITLENHSSWNDCHRFIEKFLFDYLEEPMNKPTYVRYNNRSYSCLTFSRKSIALKMKNKINELGLSVMNRKWDLIPNIQ